MCRRRYLVCFTNERDFIRGLGDTAGFDGRFEEVEVLVFVGQEGDVVGDLFWDGIDCCLAIGGGAEVGVYVSGCFTVVDIVPKMVLGCKS